MTRRGPFIEIEKKDYEILKHLELNTGTGFNELWRKLKDNGISMSFSTMSKVLKRLRDENHVDIDVRISGYKIPKHLYYKTEQGLEYQQHLDDKIRLSLIPAKRIVKAHKSDIKFNQVIIGEMPYTCEIELSSPNLTSNKEGEISRLVETFSDILIPNVAESLNKAYSGSLSLLSRGSIKESTDFLKKALSFNLRLSIIFDGYKITINKKWQDSIEEELKDLYSSNTINVPSEMELFYCWINGILNQIFHADNSPYDMSDLDGWAEFIKNFSNKWRKEKNIPPLEVAKIKEFLKDQIGKGNMSFKPIRFNSNLLQINQKLPETHISESYSFLLGLMSSLKEMEKNVN